MEKKFLTIKEAAKLIGVTTLTLRNWDENGKFHAQRHPINNYRIYTADAVEKLLKEMESGGLVRLKISKPKKIKIKMLPDED